jgi:Na+/proline symporter
MDSVLLIIILYSLGILAIAWYLSRNQNIESYFLNKRSTSLPVLLISNVTSLVGAGAVVMVIGEAYRGSLAIGFINVTTFIVAVVILGFMAGKIRDIGEKHKISTIVDYCQVRFGKKNRILMAGYQLVLLMAWIGIQAMAVTLLLSEILNISYFEAMSLTVIVCLLYSMIGGLRVDIITDVIQFWIMLFIYLAMGFAAYKLVDVGTLISTTPSEVLNPLEFKGTTWFVMVAVMMSIGYISSAPYWQRIMAAESKSVAKKSFFYAAPMTFALTLLILFLGLYAYHNITGLDNSDKAVFVLIDDLLPVWMKGIGYAAILATVASTLDNMFIAGSTIIYKEFVPAQNKKIFKARLTTLLFGLAGVLSTLIFPRLVDIGIFYMSLAVIPATTIIMGMISKKHSSNANFYSILIPMLALFALYPLLGAKTFLITTPLSVIIALSYDGCAHLFRKTLRCFYTG